MTDSDTKRCSYCARVLTPDDLNREGRRDLCRDHFKNAPRGDARDRYDPLAFHNLRDPR